MGHHAHLSPPSDGCPIFVSSQLLFLLGHHPDLVQMSLTHERHSLYLYYPCYLPHLRLQFLVLLPRSSDNVVSLLAFQVHFSTIEICIISEKVIVELLH